MTLLVLAGGNPVGVIVPGLAHVGPGPILGPSLRNVGGPSAPDFTPAITAAVYTRAGVLVADLPDSFERTFQEQLNDPGSFSLQLVNGDSAIPSITYRQVVRLAVEGAVRFAGIIETIDRATIATGEEVDEITTIGGRGTLMLLEGGRVLPARGVDIAQGNDARTFNFASPELSSAGWGTSVVSTDPLLPAADFPGDAAVARIIRPAGAKTAGVSYYRKAFSSISSQVVSIYATGTGEWTVWLDGQSIMSGSPDDTGYTGQTVKLNYRLTPGDHVFGVSQSYDSGDLGFRFVMEHLDLSTGLSSGPIVWSDVGWQSVNAPAVAPGFGAGAILAILIGEAQTRGAMVDVTVGFSVVADSYGAPWPNVPEFSSTAGASILDVVGSMVDAGLVDVWMDPGTLTLRSAPHRGVTTGVVLAAEVNLKELTHGGQL